MNDAICASFGIILILSRSPCGGWVFIKADNSLARSSNFSQPKAQAILFSLASALIKTGKSDPSTFSNSRAGPPFLTRRSAISVISSLGLTFVFILLSSPRSSKKSTKSFRDLNAMGGGYNIPIRGWQLNLPRFLFDSASQKYGNSHCLKLDENFDFFLYRKSG